LVEKEMGLKIPKKKKEKKDEYLFSKNNDEICTYFFSRNNDLILKWMNVIFHSCITK
jgi:hypothetical protein